MFLLLQCTVSTETNVISAIVKRKDKRRKQCWPRTKKEMLVIETGSPFFRTCFSPKSWPFVGMYVETVWQHMCCYPIILTVLNNQLCTWVFALPYLVWVFAYVIIAVCFSVYIFGCTCEGKMFLHKFCET